MATRESIEKLKADIQSLQEGKRRLEAGSLDRTPPGQQISTFRENGGDRRYITGIRLTGKRILILLDVSASMLHEDLVTILRLRNADDNTKRNAAKWRRAVDTVTWLTTQIPPGSQYQIYAFNTQAHALLPDMAGKWIGAGDAPTSCKGAGESARRRAGRRNQPLQRLRRDQNARPAAGPDRTDHRRPAHSG